MKTSRLRRSPSGQPAEVVGRVDDVLHRVDRDRAVRPDVEQALDAEHVGTPGVEQHRQPDPEGEPVDRARPA